jgi:Na+-transporting NADH:ubiquinone oxidoreductase subunit F
VRLTLPVREVLPATPRARLVRLDLQGQRYPYEPGQAIAVSPLDLTERKPYSLAGAPEDAGREGYLELLVSLDSTGSASRLLLEPGARVHVDGPIGEFTLPAHPEEQRFLFIAGGTGIAPLRAMLRRALRLPGRSIALLYSARTPDEFAFEHELRTLAEAGRIEFTQAVTRAAGRQWRGIRGRISREHLAPLVHPEPTLAFVCGPPTLVQDMPALVHALGVPRSQIRIDQWREHAAATLPKG